ncbi:MAG TPA: PKD domain-containing protein [Solirubrobacteraceae bacterium]|nr:PKD domain-containing protein [Solirubrobacteraceae bacterium]
MTLSKRLRRLTPLVALTAFLTLVPAVAQAAAASISLGPSSGSPGTRIMVDGKGFLGPAPITIKFDGATVASTNTDLAGNFQGASFTVPAAPAGPHQVAASDGTNSATATLTVPAPSAAFSPESAEVLPGTVIQFDGTLTTDPGNSVTSYGWDFGDGSSATGARPAHAYAKAGTYTVSLTISDSSGNTSRVSHRVTVDPLQTLIETVAPAPTVIQASAPSITNSGRFDLGQRIFCPGSGPSCTSAIKATSGLNSQIRLASASSVLSSSTVNTPADGSSEIILKLGRQAMRTFRAHKPLRLTIVISSHRGAEATITKLNVVLKKKR